MPNTAVKPANAESTWGEAPWEDRKPLIKKKALANASAFLLFVVSGSWEMRGFPSLQPLKAGGLGDQRLGIEPQQLSPLNYSVQDTKILNRIIQWR